MIMEKGEIKKLLFRTTLEGYLTFQIKWMQ